MKRFIFGLLAIGSLGFASNANAEPRVFLNGVDITYVRSQDFKGVDISIDALGNIHIVGEKYSILRRTEDGLVPETPSGVQNPEPAKSPETLVREFNTLPPGNDPVYLVATFNQPSLLGHAVSVYINGKYVRTLPQTESVQTINVMPYLVKGSNRVQYSMTKEASAGSSSRATVSLCFARGKVASPTQTELVGCTSEITLKAVDGEKSYDVILVNP